MKLRQRFPGPDACGFWFWAVWAVLMVSWTLGCKGVTTTYVLLDAVIALALTAACAFIALAVEFALQQIGRGP